MDDVPWRRLRIFRPSRVAVAAPGLLTASAVGAGGGVGGGGGGGAGRSGILGLKHIS